MSTPNSSLEIEAIADFLANCHDLLIEDIEGEFRTVMLESFPNLKSDFLSGVYAQFMRLSPETRFNPMFEHREFVRTAYQNQEVLR
jgi:hypothetical protein